MLTHTEVLVGSMMRKEIQAHGDHGRRFRPRLRLLGFLLRKRTVADERRTRRSEIVPVVRSEQSGAQRA
jgi:hypothetical protein